jgi:hypothetical protein
MGNGLGMSIPISVEEQKETHRKRQSSFASISNNTSYIKSYDREHFHFKSNTNEDNLRRDGSGTTNKNYVKIYSPKRRISHPPRK